LSFHSEHSWQTGGVDFVSKPQSLFNYSFSFRYGGYYADGEKYTVAAL